MSSESWQDEHGHWLRVPGTLDDPPGVEVRYARLLFPGSDADMDAETTGIVYGSGFR